MMAAGKMTEKPKNPLHPNISTFRPDPTPTRSKIRRGPVSQEDLKKLKQKNKNTQDRSDWKL
jgi:hypothetical protein